MPSLIEVTVALWDHNRERTLATLAAIEALPNPQQVLGWRPGAGRAHIAWQLTHIGITEELFATERLANTKPDYADLVPRFKGGSTPDDNIPAASQIREIFTHSREHLKKTVATLTEADLSRVPEFGMLRERNMTIGRALQIINWHEAHHQGQAHITLNLYKAAHA